MLVPHGGTHRANSEIRLPQGVPTPQIDNQSKGSLNGAPLPKLPSTPLATADTIQRDRYERKYLLPPLLAERIREEILFYGYLELDKFTQKSPDQHGYLVSSVYLDSPDKLTYWQTIEGDPERLKLRVRFYSDRPDAPCFFEIKKRREGQRVQKARAQVIKSKAEAFLDDPLKNPIELDFLPAPLQDNKSHIAGLFEFRDLCNQINARATAICSYRRAALEASRSNEARATIDTDLRGAPYNPLSGLTVQGRENWRPIPFKDMIGRDIACVEFKYTGDEPRWMQHLAQKHNLLIESCQKYVRVLNDVDPKHCWL